jgi:hypothetical protein
MPAMIGLLLQQLCCRFYFNDPRCFATRPLVQITDNLISSTLLTVNFVDACAVSRYIYSMYAGIKFNRAAFKHGVTEADILRAFETFIYEDPVDEGIDNKYLLLGFNLQGNLIEVMYNRINEDAVNVFHAMPCRKAFCNLAEI